jgi:hypothetical protein
MCSKITNTSRRFFLNKIYFVVNLIGIDLGTGATTQLPSL